MGDGIRLAQRDKKIQHLQTETREKKKQLKEDYDMIKQSVKDNPYLHVALAEYDKLFANERKQVQALKTLLKQVTTPADRRDIMREIAVLEKNL